MRLLFHRYVISTTEYFFRYQSKPAFIWRWYFFVLSNLNDEPHGFHFAPVLGSRGNDIYPCGVDVAVAENIRQFRHVVVDAVKTSGKQMAQAVWEHLAGRNVRPFAQGFHFPPDVAAVHGLARSGNKHRPALDFLALNIPPQLLLQGGG